MLEIFNLLHIDSLGILVSPQRSEALSVLTKLLWTSRKLTRTFIFFNVKPNFKTVQILRQFTGPTLKMIMITQLGMENSSDVPFILFRILFTTFTGNVIPL